MDYDIEGAQRRLYELAGASDDAPVWTPTLAVRILGPKCIQRRDTFGIGGLGATFPFRGRQIIFVKQGLQPEILAFVVGHELGHHVCRLDGYDEPDLEDVCDAIGAALVAPRRAFAFVLSSEGARLPSLAKRFRTTESLAALRLGETTGQPLALVSPARVRVRGDAEFSWPHEAEVRRVARAGHPKLRKTTLRDDPRRTVLQATG